jgi:hypothetical protein
MLFAIPTAAFFVIPNVTFFVITNVSFSVIMDVFFIVIPSECEGSKIPRRKAPRNDMRGWQLRMTRRGEYFK